MSDCKISIPHDPSGCLDNIFKHLATECEHYVLICYGCDPHHYLPAKDMRHHVKEHSGNRKWARRWMVGTTSLGAAANELRYLPKSQIMSPGGWTHSRERISNLVCQVTHLEKIHGRQLEKAIVRILPGNQEVPVQELRCSPLAIHDIVGQGHQRVLDAKAEEVLTHFECTYSHTGPDTYLHQPFFTCKTCRPEASGGFMAAGCCAVCAVTCHAGHDLELGWSGEENFCDCGANEMVVKCCAPWKIKIPASSEEGNEVNVSFAVRGSLGVESLVSVVGYPEPQHERKDDRKEQSEIRHDEEDLEDESFAYE
jgi:hypothetical protein